MFSLPPLVLVGAPEARGLPHPEMEQREHLQLPRVEIQDEEAVDGPREVHRRPNLRLEESRLGRSRTIGDRDWDNEQKRQRMAKNGHEIQPREHKEEVESEEPAGRKEPSRIAPFLAELNRLTHEVDKIAGLPQSIRRVQLARTLQSQIEGARERDLSVARSVVHQHPAASQTVQRAYQHLEQRRLQLAAPTHRMKR